MLWIEFRAAFRMVLRCEKEWLVMPHPSQRWFVNLLHFPGNAPVHRECINASPISFARYINDCALWQAIKTAATHPHNFSCLYFLNKIQRAVFYRVAVKVDPK